MTLRAAPDHCATCTVELDADTWYHASNCPAAKALRDSWCTPAVLADALGPFTLDVASNPRSLIQATKAYGPDGVPSGALPLGPDSLVHAWFGEDAFCNGPFSHLLPFAQKLGEARSFVFLCNTDHSTAWWRAAVAAGGVYRFDLATRQRFIPPPHIRQSTNNKPQSLLCSALAYERIRSRLSGLGQWWTATGVAA